MRSKVLCSAVLTVAALATTAPAAVTYSYVTDTPSVTKNAGESFTVHLYLRETVDGGSASILTAENGLLGAGVRVTRNASAAADPTDLTDINPSTALSGRSHGDLCHRLSQRLNRWPPTAAVPSVQVVPLARRPSRAPWLLLAPLKPAEHPALR